MAKPDRPVRPPPCAPLPFLPANPLALAVCAAFQEYLDTEYGPDTHDARVLLATTPLEAILSPVQLVDRLNEALTRAGLSPLQKESPND